MAVLLTGKLPENITNIRINAIPFNANGKCELTSQELEAGKARENTYRFELPAELKNKIEPQYKKLSSENEQIKKLILLLCDYEPSDIFDEQMRELYNEGYEDKSINLTIK